QRPGQVEGDLGSDRGGGGVDRVQAAVVGRHEQHVGHGGVRDAGQLPVQRAVLVPYDLVGGARGDAQGDGEGADAAAGGEIGEEVGGVAGEQGLGGDDGAGEEGHGGDRAAQLLQDHGGFAVCGALAAV